MKKLFTGLCMAWGNFCYIPGIKKWDEEARSMMLGWLPIIGFVIGAYIPLGNFSKTIQGVLTIVPGSHIACIYRNLLMSGTLNSINSSFILLELFKSIETKIAFSLSFTTV